MVRSPQYLRRPKTTSLLAPFGIGLALFVMAGAVTDIVERIGLFRVPLAVVRQRAAGLPRSVWGTAFAHFGIAVTLLGVVSVGTWASERIVGLKPSQTVSLSGYDLSFDGLVQRSGPNYRELVGKFTVRRGGVPIATWSRQNAVLIRARPPRRKPHC